MRPANESCENCHWPPAFHGDRVRVSNVSGLTSRTPSEDTYLILKTGGGQRDRGLGLRHPLAHREPGRVHRQRRGQAGDPLGAHHSARWPHSRVQRCDQAAHRGGDCPAPRRGRWTAWTATTASGHPFPSPEDLVDAALADGRLSQQTCPMSRRRCYELLIGRLCQPGSGPGSRRRLKQTVRGRATPRPRQSIRPRSTQAQPVGARSSSRGWFRGARRHLEGLSRQWQAQGLCRLLPLPRRQAPERRGRVDPAALQHLPQHSRVVAAGEPPAAGAGRLRAGAAFAPGDQLHADHRFQAERSLCGVPWRDRSSGATTPASAPIPPATAGPGLR